MIPKTIHYCWFGRNPLPKLAKKCISSWRKYCPEYEIREWNEDNVDLSTCPLYVRQAYDAKKWAFVTDYVRLKVVHENGGIYLDTDVELIKPLNSLLDYDAYFGFEDGIHINTGLGFGTVRSHPILKELMDDYQNTPFIFVDGTYNLEPCPKINTKVFLRYGLIQNNTSQTLKDIHILPSDFLCPIEHSTKLATFTKNTVSIHHFNASWMSKDELKRLRKELNKYKRIDFLHNITHIPHRILRKLIGDTAYNNFKRRFRN